MFQCWEREHVFKSKRSGAVPQVWTTTLKYVTPSALLLIAHLWLCLFVWRAFFFYLNQQSRIQCFQKTFANKWSCLKHRSCRNVRKYLHSRVFSNRVTESCHGCEDAAFFSFEGKQQAVLFCRGGCPAVCVCVCVTHFHHCVQSKCSPCRTKQTSASGLSHV